MVVSSGNSSIRYTASPSCKLLKNLIEEMDSTLVDKMRSSSHGSPGIPSFNLPIHSRILDKLN